jgi:hypothetical protein
MSRLCLFLCACSSAAPSPTVELTALFSLPGPIIADLIALGDGKLGVFTLTPGSETTFCPDCETMHLGDACPAACRRDRISYSVVDESGHADGAPAVIRSYFPATPNDSLYASQSARLSDGRMGVAWQICHGPPDNVCDAEYAVFSAAGAPSMPATALYSARWGDLDLVANPVARQLLFLRASPESTRAGVHVRVSAEDGTPLQDWTRVGSSFARRARAVADDAAFTVVAEDDDPDANDAACPDCTTLIDCRSSAPGCAWGGPPAANGGLHAFSGAAAGHRLVASGWGEDGLYHDHDSVGAAWRSGTLSVASWWRNHEQLDVVRLQTDGKSERRLQALGDAIPARWLQPSPGADGSLLFVGEVTAPGAMQLQPRTFLVGTLDGAPAKSGSLRGYSFAETLSEAGPQTLYWAAGILTADLSAYDHWEIYRLRRR